MQLVPYVGDFMKSLYLRVYICYLSIGAGWAAEQFAAGAWCIVSDTWTRINREHLRQSRHLQVSLSAPTGQAYYGSYTNYSSCIACAHEMRTGKPCTCSMICDSTPPKSNSTEFWLNGFIQVRCCKLAQRGPREAVERSKCRLAGSGGKRSEKNYSRPEKNYRQHLQ